MKIAQPRSHTEPSSLSAWVCSVMVALTAMGTEADEPSVVDPEQQVAAEVVPEPMSVEHWVEQLSDDSYLRRKRASKELVKLGRDAVKPLVMVTDQGDLETTERAIQILQEIAVAAPLLKTPSDQPPAIDTADDAWNHLETLADSGGSRGGRAQVAIDEIRDVRRVQATDQLSSEGVFVGITEFIVKNHSELKRIVQIDESFSGNIDSLGLLRWIDQISYARVKGSAIQHDVLENVVQMPQLQTIAILQGTIDMESLRVLGELPSIRHLEFRYVPLTAEMVDYLASLPITVSLTLMGTGAPVANVEALQQALPGLHLEFKQGGFLGVKCFDTGKECVINEVVPKSGAESAGLLPGDIIIEVDDKPVQRFSDLQAAINSHVPNDSINLRFIRGEVAMQAIAKLGKLVED